MFFVFFCSSLSDIDLYSGALSETVVEGGSVGETYACLLGIQFQNLKYGDRFWYERTTSEGFTAGKLLAFLPVPPPSSSSFFIFLFLILSIFVN